jgi:2-C-methyl-D-erythritol 4-phosphate cytidylyltransferase
VAKVSVIIAAAGAGRRFGGGGNKIFQPLGGEAMFLRTLRLFAGRANVCQLLLVVSAGDLDGLKRRFAAELEEMCVEPVVGGAVRSESVRNALARLDAAAELVCVHDAVRPCTAAERIDAVFAAAARTGAAILACPVHATLKKVADDRVERTVPRGRLWAAQTPQVFRRDVLLRAYAGGGEATDDAALVEAVGGEVAVVLGDPRNIKITTPADLALAEAVIAARQDPAPQPPPAGGGGAR